MKKIYTTIAFLMLTINSYSQELQKEYEYTAPSQYEFITNIPDDYMQLYDMSTDSENAWAWLAIAGSTAVLWYYDDELVEWAKDLGDELGIDGSGEETSNVILAIGPYPLLKLPTDTGSALYFIGDGTVHLGIMAGFAGYGYFGDNTKALSVGSQLAEGLLDVGIATQILKHITGRETPNTATKPRGNWDVFPNQEDYAANVQKYDAFPSGHLATTMMTVTVLHENYPDNGYILPIGYTLMSLLSFQMLNNGVHWASDYPLAIGIGYSFGKIVSKRAIDKAESNAWAVVPKMYQGSYGLALTYTF